MTTIPLTISPQDWQGDDATICAVLLTPLSTLTQAEVLNLLHQIGAQQVEEIATGFISAQVPENSIPLLEELAQVEIKRPYQMR